nr:C-type lectin domain family 2 member L [Anas platyrhynchos]
MTPTSTSKIYDSQHWNLSQFVVAKASNAQQPPVMSVEVTIAEEFAGLPSQKPICFEPVCTSSALHGELHSPFPWTSDLATQPGSVANKAATARQTPHETLVRSASPPGLFSNIWFWRGVAGILVAAVVLILCIHFVNHSSDKDIPACPSLELCPSDWLYFQKKCYYLSEREANWNSSQNFCSLRNASLLVIENLQELSFMVKITKQDPWIGLHKINEEFFWVNGSTLDNKLIEVKGSGNCAYLESKGVSASGCYLTRKWVCSLSTSLA